MVVQTLVQRHLYFRGDTYYFRYVLPAHIKIHCSSLPTEIKRSLRTDSYSVALALVGEKLPLINLIRSEIKDNQGLLKELMFSVDTTSSIAA